MNSDSRAMTPHNVDSRGMTPLPPVSLEDRLQRNEAALNNWRMNSDSRAMTPLPPDPSLEDRLQ
eukprot:234614-Prorocentrum_minimum.AAC.1